MRMKHLFHILSSHVSPTRRKQELKKRVDQELIINHIHAATSSMRFDQELLDAVLYTFVKGGFFSRANEVVEMMEKKNMFVDKYKYRMLFLKYHKTAYKGKAPKVQSESQLKKREAGLAFKKWLGLS